MGRAAARDRSIGGWSTPRWRSSRRWWRPRGRLRRTRGETAGEELGTALVNRSMVNVGTLPGSPDPPTGQVGGGQARRQPRVWAGGGAPVVVRGRESRPHGEGGQRVRSGGTGMPGG